MKFSSTRCIGQCLAPVEDEEEEEEEEDEEEEEEV
jgi:hypothetical protein